MLQLSLDEVDSALQPGGAGWCGVVVGGGIRGGTCLLQFSPFVCSSL